MASPGNAFAHAHPLDEIADSLPPYSRSAGVSVALKKDRAMVQLFASKGMTKKVESALKIKSGPGQSSKGSGFTALPLAPGQWLLICDKSGERNFNQTIERKVRGIGHVSEQSDSRVIFSLTGRNARDLMIRGCRLDLHPSVARTGFCAQTQMAQVGVIVHQIDDAPTYDLLVYSGYARDFSEWLVHTGGQFAIGFSKSEK